MHIDIPTIALLSVLISALMAVVLEAHRRTLPALVDGGKEWVLATSLGTIAGVLIGLQQHLPAFFGFFCANVLLVATTLVYYAGMRRFLGMPARHPRLLAVLVLFALLYLWFLYGQPHGGVRIGLNAAFASAVTGMHFYLLWRRGASDLGTRFMLTAIGISLVSALGRLVFSFSLSADATSASMGDAASLLTVIYALSYMMMTISFIMLSAQRVREELEHLASHDPLTGVLNRRALLDNATREIDRCRRNGANLCLLALDLDHFKQVNDQHGHQVGDQVLIDFARRAEAQLRSADRIGRFGGEEFIISLPETGLVEAAAVAERIRLSLRDAAGLPPYTVSIGVAEARPTLSVDGMLQAADAALYRAKAAGRNTVSIAEPPVMGATGNAAATG